LPARPTRPFFERIDLHGELAHRALQFGNFALVLGDPHRLGDFVGELATFVLRTQSRIRLRDRL
jgi:hypothetical protein